MILAAGRGQRMLPLTDDTPKPLLQLGDSPVIVHLIRALARGDLRDIVINYAHLGEKITEALGDGSDFGVNIRYSPETGGALETGGGIYKALPLLDSDPFAVVNGDIWTDYPFASLPRRLPGRAHVVLVNNPPHHRGGDFVLRGTRVSARSGPKLTFSGIGVYAHALFEDCKPGRVALAPLLKQAMTAGLVGGEHYAGHWIDVGTPERRRKLEEWLSARRSS